MEGFTRSLVLGLASSETLFFIGFNNASNSAHAIAIESRHNVGADNC